MTHAQKAAQAIDERCHELSAAVEDLATIIQTPAIKPAVDEATRELKDGLRNLVEFIKGDVCCLDDDCPRGVRTKQAITAAEKLLQE